MLDGLPLLASVRYKAKEYRMEGRSGKRVGVAGARENAAVAERIGRRGAGSDSISYFAFRLTRSLKLRTRVITKRAQAQRPRH